jgi:hypothetical protein
MDQQHAAAGDKLVEVKLDDQERGVVCRLLTERTARLIEIAEDTTEPDLARRAGLSELLTIASIVGKLRCATSRNRCS